MMKLIQPPHATFTPAKYDANAIIYSWRHADQARNRQGTAAGFRTTRPLHLSERLSPNLAPNDLLGLE